MKPFDSRYLEVVIRLDSMKKKGINPTSINMPLSMGATVFKIKKMPNSVKIPKVIIILP